MGRLVIVSGPPGAGKSTMAQRLSRGTAAPLAMHMHTDDFYAYIRKGFVEPWRPESQAQNVTLMNAMASAAGICASGGYDVFVDGIVGPWFFDPWVAAARERGLELHYVLLMPDEPTTVARATARTGPGAMTDPEVSRQMWRHFLDCEIEARHRVDSTAHAEADTATAVAEGVAEGRFRLA